MSAAAATPVFSSRTVAWLLGVGVLAFAGLVALAAFAPELRTGDDGGGHALSRSAVGYAGLQQLLRGVGVPVVVSRGPLPPPADKAGVLALTPGDDRTFAELARMEPRRRKLVVLPKWSAVPDPRHAGWVLKVAPLPTVSVAAMFGEKGPAVRQESAPRAPRLKGAAGFLGGSLHQIGPVEALQTVAAPAASVLIADEAGRAVLFRQGDLLVLSDPDLLNDHGLRSQATARFAVAMLDAVRQGGPVVFDVTLNGLSRSRSLLRLALGPPFLGATLCALAAALLAGVHAAVRFGSPAPPERAFALGKRALVDNAAALIRLARREPRMGARYAALTRRAVARAIVPEREAEADRTAALLDRLTPAGEAPLSALAAAAAGASDETALMQAARRLHQRRVEMTREPR